MKEFRANEIRNFAVIGHSGEGKTTLTEAILFNAKATDRQGKTSDGNTVSDFDAEEIARKISISLSVQYAVYNDIKFNIIDVPGFFDFEGEQVSALAAADSAIIVASSQGTVSVGTEKALKLLEKHKIPATIFINGMDKENADYFKTVDALKAMYPTKIAPIQIPIMREQKMQGYISVLSGNSYEFSPEGRKKIDMPPELKPEYEKILSELAEVAASNDDELMEKFFEQGTLPTEDIVRGVKSGIKQNNAIPVIAGSALFNKGVFNLMDNLIRLSPSPTDKDKACTDDAPFTAQVFKTIADPFVGRLSLFKIRSGVLKNGAALFNATRDSSEKVNGIYVLKGKKQEAVNELHAGDIGAISKLSNTYTGDTLCDDKNAAAFPPIEFPGAVLSMAVYATKQGDEDKIFQGLAKLAEEDPSFKIERGAETGETLLTGVGETQLDVIIKKLKNKYSVDAVLKTPKIAYRETIKKSVEARGKHKKQSGGHGQYGDAAIRFEPCYEQDFVFADEIVGGVVPKTYIPAVEKGLRECIAKGVLAGYPVVNLKCTLFDGSYHDVDSSEMAFNIAASLAFKEGMPKANPVLLEPIYEYKIRIPADYLGDILGDLNRRRGRILGMDMDGDEQVVSAEVPISEMMKYATDLRSMTQGRGSFENAFLRYEEVPSNLTQKIVEEAKKAE